MRCEPASARVSRRMISLLVLFCQIEKGLNLLAERSEFCRGNIPDDCIVDAEVIVNQSVAHSRDLPPFDFRLLGPKVFGNLLRRLADDLKASDESSLQGGVLAERMEVLPGELRQNVVDLLKNMSDVLTRRPGHAPSPEECGGLCKD